MHSFTGWENFYVIVGSSAAALTGLQFVVMVLGAEANSVTHSAVRAFGTPTVIHFCAALFVSAILSAPWHSIAPAAVCLAIYSAAGLLYLGVILRHAQQQKDYVPVAEDWLWYFILPGAAYVVHLIAAITLTSHTENALFAIGAATLTLLFIGIRNAWDSVSYIALNRKEPPA